MEWVPTWQIIIGLACGFVMAVRFGAVPTMLFFTILAVITELAGAR